MDNPMDEKMKRIFFEIHSELPQEAPGNRESTAKAFGMLTDLPPEPRLLDVGCGPGRQTLDLAALTDGQITAVDNHEPFVQSLQQRIAAAGLKNRVKAVVGDMTRLNFPSAHFDVIWSEGAIYIMGFMRGLKSWARFLRPGGYLAVTEITWLKEDPPQELQEFWQAAYPVMQNITENLERISEQGYVPLGCFILPEDAWWDNYYHPLQKRVNMLLNKYRTDKPALDLLQTELREIELYRRYWDYYGYVFYVMRKAEH